MPSPRTIGIGILLLAVALSGCTGDTSDPEPAPEPITAEHAYELALEAAVDWQPDAFLVIMAGFEGSSSSVAVEQARDEDRESSFPIHADPQPGDGKAPAWLTMFYSPTENATVSYRVSTNGLEPEDASLTSSVPQRLGNWTVDSPAAIQTARENETFSRGLAAQDASLFMTLGSGENGTARWQLTVLSREVSVRTTVLVDALTGGLMPAGRGA